MEDKKKQKLHKVLDVLSYVGVFLFFALALTCAIFKFQGAKFNIFGKRYDVVLTNSMSEKNEKYADFLAGHDDQYQAFDLAVSKPIKQADDLRLYDVVIYKDRAIGTNMHRIVGIEENGHDTVTFKGAKDLKLGDYDGIGLQSVISKIETSDLSFKTLEMTVYTETGSSDSHYNFSIVNESLDYTVSSVDSGEGKLVTYRISKQSTAPGKLSIAHKTVFDYNKETIISLKIDAASGKIETNKSDFSFEDANAVANYNQEYRFEIRGDKASDSDGYYSLDELEAKVIKNIPKMGYLVRFLNSLWGGLMFLLLGILFLVFDILMSHMNKKEAMATASKKIPASVPVEESKEEIKDEPKPESVIEPVPELKPEPKEHEKRYYQVVKRDDGMWKVVSVETKNTVKVFSTQKEAKDYSKKLTEKAVAGKK